MLRSPFPCPVCSGTRTKFLGIQVQRIGGNEIHTCRECQDKYTTRKFAAGMFIVDRELQVAITPRWYITLQREALTKQSAKDQRKAERKEKKLKEFLEKRGIIDGNATDAFTE